MAELVYTTSYLLRSHDVTLHRVLRTSRLFELLQEASITHTEQLGYPRATTLDRGYLWVIARQRVEIARMPAYDERIELRSWPGAMMHVLYPRYYELVSEGGEVLVRGSAVWALISEHTRKFAFPQDTGVEIASAELGRELALPRGVREQACEHEEPYAVPFSACDLNGHMNNTRYLDVADDQLAHVAAGGVPASIEVDYQAECRFGDELTLRWHEDEAGAYFSGVSAGDGAGRFRIAYSW